MNPVEFLTELWGGTPPGLIQIWELQRRRSGYYRAPVGTAGLNGRADVYTAVALAHKNLGASKRARADQAVAIAGLWLDIDVDGGPNRKTGGVPTVEDAITLAHHYAAPTLLINSGYGVHAWYLLDGGPWRFTSREQQQTAGQMSAQWYALHRAEAQQHGWGLDHTHDLARLLRLPGTINAKGGGQARVELIDQGPRQVLTVLRALCDTAGAVLVDASSSDPDTGGALPEIVARDGRIDSDRLNALVTNSPEFASAWRHQRGAGWTMSEYDLSIATQAAQAGFTDQELADLIAHHRRLWDPADAKATRLDYLRRTIARARTTGQRSSAAERLAQLARTGSA